MTVNAEVASWWKGNAKSDSSSLPSMMFEDNVGEDGISAQSSYTIDINDLNYIDNLAPDPTMFDNEVLLGMDTLKKVYTQLISALNGGMVLVVQQYELCMEMQPHDQCYTFFLNSLHPWHPIPMKCQ